MNRPNDMLTGVRLPNLSALIFTGTCALAAASVSAQVPAEPTPGAATFNVFLSATPTGLERTLLTRTPDGWVIHSSGQILSPVDLQNQRFELVYNAEWRPERLTIDGRRGGTTFSIRTTFDAGEATNDITEGNLQSRHSEAVDQAAVVLPNYFFAAYEALAARLTGARPGDTLPIYVAPRGEITARVNDMLTQQLETADRALNARIYRITFLNPGQPLDAEVWVDDNLRLLRVSLPSVALEVAREDIVSVSSRVARARHPGDEDVRVQSAGFSLAATVTTPLGRDAATDGRWPAVLLVPGSGPVDRDENVSGVPIFGQLAGTLAEAGYLVARYDKRGAGQSGGRPESATLEDYAEDVREMVRYLDDRDDVDRDRITVVGHSEGGWVALLAASRENKIAALALIAAPGIAGRDLVLEQQRAELARLELPESERQERIVLQERILDAVVGDGSWESVPANLRRQADTAWFRSFLDFEPAEVVRRVRQPLLVLQGELDQQVPPHHADRLEELARARRRREARVEVVTLAGINHLLVPATTGSLDEYASLTDAQVAPQVVEALTDWIRRSLP